MTNRQESSIRIAVVRPLASPIDRSSYNSQELGLGSALARLSCDVDVYVAGGNGSVTKTEIDAGGTGRLRLCEVPFKKIPNVEQAVMPAMRKMLRSERYDFIQVNESNEIESWLVARTAKRKGIPVSLYQGMYRPIAGRVQTAFQAMYDRVLLPGLRRSITAPLAKTQRAAEFLRARGFGGVRVLPVGLDPSPFQDPIGRDWRAELGISTNHELLTYVGVLERRRRPDLILDIASTLRNEPVSFLLAGIGPEESSVRNAVARRELNNVHLLWRLSQRSLPGLYQQSSFLLLPSTYEIYGMVVLEAMYFGLPVISNRTAGPESLIDTGKDGILVDDLEARTWVEAIRKALASRAHRDAMSHAARDKVFMHLTWDRIAHTYLHDVICPAVANTRFGETSLP